jgi:signal transduction histidine kinase
LKFFFQEKDISITFELPDKCIEINGDRNRIKRTIANLLGNSIKYSLDGEEIRVRCRVVDGCDHSLKSFFGAKIYRRLQPGQSYILTTVHDNGFGIPKKYQQAIFEKFFTLDTRDGQGRRGLGLGLAFCKLVVEAHGGAICAKTPPRSEITKKTRGCLFSFLLPYGI